MRRLLLAAALTTLALPTLAQDVVAEWEKHLAAGATAYGIALVDEEIGRAHV